MSANATTDDIRNYEAFQPCPNCGTDVSTAPEGVNVNGTPNWNETHCYKCGFRPGVNEASNAAQLARDFQAFQEFQARQRSEQGIDSHPSLNPPASDEDAAQRKSALEAALNPSPQSPTGEPISQQPVVGNSQDNANSPGMNNLAERAADEPGF